MATMSPQQSTVLVKGVLNVMAAWQVVSLHLNTMTTLQLFRGDTVQIKVYFPHRILLACAFQLLNHKGML
jgi:hypothetical protein